MSTENANTDTVENPNENDIVDSKHKELITIHTERVLSRKPKQTQLTEQEMKNINFQEIDAILNAFPARYPAQHAVKRTVPASRAKRSASLCAADLVSLNAVSDSKRDNFLTVRPKNLSFNVQSTIVESPFPTPNSNASFTPLILATLADDSKPRLHTIAYPTDASLISPTIILTEDSYNADGTII